MLIFVPILGVQEIRIAASLVVSTWMPTTANTLRWPRLAAGSRPARRIKGGHVGRDSLENCCRTTVVTVRQMKGKTIHGQNIIVKS